MRAFSIWIRKRRLLLRDRFFFFLLFGDFFSSFLARLLVFLFQLGADEFDDREFGAVADSPAGADDAGVATRAINESRSEVGEELLGRVRRHEKRGSLPPGVERI